MLRLCTFLTFFFASNLHVSMALAEEASPADLALETFKIEQPDRRKEEKKIQREEQEKKRLAEKAKQEKERLDSAERKRKNQEHEKRMQQEGAAKAKELFESLKTQIQEDTEVQNKILHYISEKGSPVLLVGSDWNMGIYSHFGISLPRVSNSSYVVSELGKKTLRFFGRHVFRHVFEEGTFQGWTLEASTVIRPAFVFVLIIPDTQLRITLSK